MATNREDLTHLLALADELAQETKLLSGQTADNLALIGKKTSKNSVLIWGLAASFALDLILTVLLGFGFISLQDQGKDLNAVTKRLDYSQTVQRQKALCPLYQVFLDSKTPEARAAAPDAKKYDRAFDVIEDGYKALQCADFKGSGVHLGG